MPDYLRHMNEVLTTRPVADVQTYLRWHLLRSAAPLLSQDFVDQAFDFQSRTLAGTKELAPRWKRCANLATGVDREAVGIAFVERDVRRGRQGAHAHDGQGPRETRCATTSSALDWMTPATKERALAKLAVIDNKIGYPAHPRDYAQVEMQPRDLVGNVQRVFAYEARRDLGKIGQPVDKSEWEIRSVRGERLLQPAQQQRQFPGGHPAAPVLRQDDGRRRELRGHRDDHRPRAHARVRRRGRQYDVDGNLKDWWTPEDGKAFDERASCMVEQYGRFARCRTCTSTDGSPWGKRGRQRRAAHRLRRADAAPGRHAGRVTNAIDGFSPPQRFFLGMAQGWCENSTDELRRLITKTDEHT
jgi:predicted metalloendopeptidase